MTEVIPLRPHIRDDIAVKLRQQEIVIERRNRRIRQLENQLKRFGHLPERA